MNTALTPEEPGVLESVEVKSMPALVAMVMGMPVFAAIGKAGAARAGGEKPESGRSLAVGPSG